MMLFQSSSAGFAGVFSASHTTTPRVSVYFCPAAATECSSVAVGDFDEDFENKYEVGKILSIVICPTPLCRLFQLVCSTAPTDWIAS